MSELFKTNDDLSPREKWIRTNAVKIREMDNGTWSASNQHATMMGDSRDDALAKIAQKLWSSLKIKPWNMA